MIEEIKDKVKQYFERTKDLRVLFFFDEAKEYAESIDQLSIPGITLVKWENNPFTLKVKLTTELKNEKVLLYLPMKHPSNQAEYQNFPLLGLLIANKDLNLDDSGALLEEFGLRRHQKSLINEFMSELKYTRVKEVCKPILSSEKLSKELLQQGILSAALKFKRIQNWPMLIAKLTTLSLNESEFKRVSRKITDLRMEEAILNQIDKLVDTSIPDLSLDSLKTIAQSFRYNQITQTITEVNTSDPYAFLKTNDQEKIIQLNQVLFAIEADNHLSKQFAELFDKIDQEIKGDRIIQSYGVEQEYAVYSQAMLWSVIQQSLNLLFHNPSNAFKLLEKLSLQNGLKDEIAYTISFLSQTAKLVNQINSVNSYILNSPEAYIQWYEQEAYLIDQYYRRSISSRKLIDDTELPKTIKINEIVSKLNEQYELHTDKLNREWLKCLNENNFDYSKIKHAKQYDFYQTEIEALDQKVVVIVSDALRYEAGVELLSEMHGDPKNTAEVRSMLASLPSKTNIGMAQLLPGKSFKFNTGDVSIDRISTSGTENRALIIQAANTEGTAVQLSSLEGGDINKLRDLFKKEIVYVYHDVIDATGDKKPSERRTFDAVSEAIKELKKFVKSLHATYNVAKVYITADHGFLYADSTIQDKNLERIDDSKAVSTHNRYCITKSDSSEHLGYTFPLSRTTKFEENLFVTIPKSINRYRKQGVGHQFVHGGGSLQELIIPLIESSRKREAVSRKVKPVLIANKKLSVVSNILRFNLLQKEPVSRTEKEIELLIGLYDDRDLVSNEERKIMNFTSDSPSERMLKIELILSQEASNTSFLKLKVFDADDRLNPIIEETIQNNTLIQTDF